MQNKKYNTRQAKIRQHTKDNAIQCNNNIRLDQIRQDETRQNNTIQETKQHNIIQDKVSQYKTI